MTIDELAGEVAALRIEVQRGKEMLQTLSESHDQNRRELQVATKTAADLSIVLDQHVANAAAILSQVKAVRG